MMAFAPPPAMLPETSSLQLLDATWCGAVSLLMNVTVALLATIMNEGETPDAVNVKVLLPPPPPLEPPHDNAATATTANIIRMTTSWLKLRLGTEIEEIRDAEIRMHQAVRVIDHLARRLEVLAEQQPRARMQLERRV